MLFSPPFCLPGLDEERREIEFCLKDWLSKGYYIVLYFYPKDHTAGCTKEALDFSSKREAFPSSFLIVGVSPDSIASHKKFQEKYQLKLILLSDSEGEVAKSYGAWGKKKIYGKEREGIIRSTFIINPEGKILKGWFKVKVEGHVNEVLSFIKSLSLKGEGE